MGTTAEKILNKAQSGRVTTVFCPDVTLGRRQVRAAAEELEPLPTVVTLEWEEAPSLANELDEIRDALGDAAASLWPDWYITAEGRFDPGRAPHGETPSPPFELARQVAGASSGWLREAWRLCSQGQRPVVAHMASTEQVRQLALALDPSRLLFALSVASEDAPPARLRGLAKAAECCSGN